MKGKLTEVIKKILGGVLLGLAAATVIVVSPMTKMNVHADAEKPADYDTWPRKVHSGCEHPDVVHFWANGETYRATRNGETYDAIEGRHFVSEGSKDSYPGCGSFGGYDFDKDLIAGELSKGWYFCNWNGSGSEEKFYPCKTNHSDDDNDDNDGSNDDDSRPAGPTPHQSEQNLILRTLDTQLSAIDSSSNAQITIDSKELVNALPNATMKKIADKPNVTVFFTYTYNNEKYTSAIPGTNVDTSLEWYGPVYMMTHYPTIWRQDANTAVPVVAPVR